MKIIKVNSSQQNAYISIKSSLDNNKEFSVSNQLDACGCTGNGFC